MPMPTPTMRRRRTTISHMFDLRSVVVLLTVVGGLALDPAGVRAQEWRTMSVSRQLSGESSLEVELNHVAGVLHLEPSNGRVLYSMDLRYDERAFDPIAEFDGRRLHLGVEGRGRDLRIKSDGSDAEMRVALTRDVPMDLSLRFGAGRADVALGGLRLVGMEIETGASETEMTVSRPNREIMRSGRIAVGAAQFTALQLGNLNAERLEVEAGVGEVVLDLSGEWKRDGNIEVTMGLGSLELRVPEGLGLKLVKQAFLTSLDAPEMDRDGDVWYSRDWESAERRVTVEVAAAFGAVKVVWLP
jgi:hypothetical protein